MIEWIPIKEFLRGANEFEHFLFINARNGCISKGALVNYSISTLLASYTHAAKINLPVEKTLSVKFKDKIERTDLSLPIYMYEELAKIAKQHYEGEK